MLPANGAAASARSITAKPGCMPHWFIAHRQRSSTAGCICPRSGPVTVIGARLLVCRKTSLSKPNRNWPLISFTMPGQMAYDTPGSVLTGATARSRSCSKPFMTRVNNLLPMSTSISLFILKILVHTTLIATRPKVERLLDTRRRAPGWWWNNGPPANQKAPGNG